MYAIKARGTISSKVQVGLGGPFLKNEAGYLSVRDPTDTTYAPVAAEFVVQPNADAADGAQIKFANGVIRGDYGELGADANTRLRFVTKISNTPTPMLVLINNGNFDAGRAIGCNTTAASNVGVCATAPYGYDSMWWNGSNMCVTNKVFETYYGGTSGSFYLSIDAATYVGNRADSILITAGGSRTSTTTPSNRTVLISTCGDPKVSDDCVSIGGQSVASTMTNGVQIGCDTGTGTTACYTNGVAIGATTKANSNSVAIGYAVAAYNTDSIEIGVSSSAAGANQIVLGSAGQYVFQCYAAYAGTVGATRRQLYADNTGKIGYVSSSLRYKENVIAYTDQAALGLRPVVFDYKAPNVGTDRLGFIAEEVFSLVPEAVSLDAGNVPLTVNLSDLVVPLISVLKKLVADVSAMEEELLLLEGA
jgi:hypothetical protein